MVIISLGTKKSSSVLETLDASILGIPRIFEILESPDLFGETKHFKIVRADDTPELKEELLEFLTNHYSLAHTADIILDKLLAPEKRKIEGQVIITEQKSTKSAESPTKINPFALGEAIASGDKKKAWTLFHQITYYNGEIEKTHGLVWWKIKDLFTKKSVYPKETVIAMARSLVDVYHQSRLGGVEMKERLERFIISLPPVPKK